MSMGTFTTVDQSSLLTTSAGIVGPSTLSEPSTTPSIGGSGSSSGPPPQSGADFIMNGRHRGSPNESSLGSSSPLFVGRLKLPPAAMSTSKKRSGKLPMEVSSIRSSHPMTIRRRRSSGDKQDVMETSVAADDIHHIHHYYRREHDYHSQLSSSFPSKPTSLLSSSPSAFMTSSSMHAAAEARKKSILLTDPVAKAQSRSARKLNDSMVYLEGPQIYACVECRTHLTTHDEIISKSFHGRRGRAYLFDNCVNVTIGPSQERVLMTGLHSVCDIFCKRCKTMVGWMYIKAFEQSQKYKEGKFIVEKINLHLEESDYYNVIHPAGEHKHRFHARSITWGTDKYSRRSSPRGAADVFEYDHSTSSTMSMSSSSSSRLDLP